MEKGTNCLVGIDTKVVSLKVLGMAKADWWMRMVTFMTETLKRDFQRGRDCN